MEEKEIWVDIVGYEGLYQISSKKRVKSLGNSFSRKEKILKTTTSVNLSKNGIKKSYKIKDLYAEAFGIEEVDKSNKINTIEDLEREIWKPIKDHNKYMISNYGRVKAIRNKKEKLCKTKCGAVNICGQCYNINLLVLEHFGHIVLLDEEEEFRDIPNYEGLYKISNRKRVLNLTTGKILKYAYYNNNISVRTSKDDGLKSLTVDLLYNQVFGGETVEDLEGEIWKNVCDIEGFEDFVDYQISNLGRVKSLKNWSEKILKPTDNGYGYLKVGLNCNGKNKSIQVHRLVGLAFIPNDDTINKKELNHINEIKTDNRAENLEWCDRSYNVNYGTRTEKQKQTCIENGIYEKANKKRMESEGYKNRKSKGTKVYCEELDRVFPSIQSIEDEFGYCRTNISYCLRHIDNQQMAYGMHWYYADEYFGDEN